MGGRKGAHELRQGEGPAAGMRSVSGSGQS